MTTAATRSVVIEKELPHPPEKIWRALTEGPLIKEWLMENDFQPVVGHAFTLRIQAYAGLERHHRLPGAGSWNQTKHFPIAGAR